MQNWVWLTPLGYVAAAMIAGLFLVWNNKPRTHEVLQAYAEIFKELPEESPARAQLLAQIESQVARITAVSAEHPLSEIDVDLERPPRAAQIAVTATLLIGGIGAFGAPLSANLGAPALAAVLGVATVISLIAALLTMALSGRRPD